MSKRSEARQKEKEENKITETLNYRKVPYTNNKRVLTRSEEKKIENLVMSQSPFKEMAEALKDSPYQL